MVVAWRGAQQLTAALDPIPYPASEEPRTIGGRLMQYAHRVHPRDPQALQTGVDLTDRRGKISLGARSDGCRDEIQTAVDEAHRTMSKVAIHCGALDLQAPAPASQGRRRSDLHATGATEADFDIVAKAGIGPIRRS